MKEPPDPMARIVKKPRRLWRWLRRALLSLLVLALVSAFGTWVELQWEAVNGRKELAEVVASLDGQDPGWKLAPRDKKVAPIPEEKNSVLVAGKVADALGKWNSGDVKLPDGRDAYDANHPSNRRLDGLRLAAIRDALGKREPAVALAVSLERHPQGRARVQITPDVLSTLLPHIDPIRRSMRLLELDLERQIDADRLDLGPARVVAILNAGAGLRDDPFLISALVRYASRSIACQRVERLLGMGELTDGACASLQARFAAERPAGELVEVLQGERALMNRLFEDLGSGRLAVGDFLATSAGNSKSKPDLSLRLGGALYSYRVPEDHAQFLRWFQEAIVIAGLPGGVQKAEWEVWEKQLRQARSYSRSSRRLILSTLFTPGLQKVADGDLRTRAVVAATETALAVERFRLAKSRWPRTLGELCPAFLDAVPLDPFTDAPLLYVRHPDGVAVYSVGPDLKDDGGKVLRHQREGNWDVGIRLYDPDQRGLPARP